MEWLGRGERCIQPDAEAAQEEAEMSRHLHKTLEVHWRSPSGAASMEQEKARVGRTRDGILAKVRSKVPVHSLIACRGLATVLWIWLLDLRQRLPDLVNQSGHRL